MQTIVRFFLTLGAMLMLGLAVWFSLTIFGILLLAGGGLVLFYALRQFLLEKGILNPTPGVPMPEPEGEQTNVTIIETSYTHLPPNH